MSTRRAIALMLLVCLAGCANNATQPASSASIPPSSPPFSAPPASSSSVPGAETISGTVEEGVEPNCRLLNDAAGAHLLVFGSDTVLRAEAPVGAKVTLTGRSEPGMMSTCQQGIPFIVSAVRAG